MSADKFTPGPWMWDSDSVKGDPIGRIRYQVVAQGKTIAKTYYSSFEGGLTNAEADTRLIAAAPELLAVLETIVRVADGRTISGNLILDENSPLMDAARAAIAKAIGGAV